MEENVREEYRRTFARRPEASLYSFATFLSACTEEGLSLERHQTSVPFTPWGSERKYCDGALTCALSAAAACHGQCGL